MGSLCDFHLLKHPHSFKPLTIHTNTRALPAFRSPSNANARLGRRTRKPTPCLVAAQENHNNNGRNPEKPQKGGKKNPFNAGNNGFWPKQKTAAQNELDNKNQKSNVLRESFASKFRGVLLKMINSDFVDRVLGLISLILGVSYNLVWDTFWFVTINGLKVSTVVAIIGFSYVYLY